MSPRRPSRFDEGPRHHSTARAAGPRVAILREGFSRMLTPAVEQAACTITLIQTPRTNTIVETGSPPDGPFIEAALEAAGLELYEIHFVVCTHGHADHIGNNGLFDTATFVVSQNVTKGDLFLGHDWAGPFIIDEGVTVEAAPGHTVHHNVVHVQAREGTIAVAGDTFLGQDDEAERERWLAYSELPEKHLETRDRIRERADFIIPGHGAMFRAK